MSYEFPLQCANIVAYMTSRRTDVPRVARGTLVSLLGTMAIPEGRLFSRDSVWIERLQKCAQTALDRCLLHHGDDQVPTQELVEMLEPLRKELSSFALYALIVDEHDDQHASRTLETAARFLAGLRLPPDTSSTSERGILCLIPYVDSGWRAQVLDPFPAFATALEHVDDWPGLLCWSPVRASAFVPAADAHDATIEIVNVLREAGRIDEWLERKRRQPSKRILHLSDLHFGSRHAAQNLALLEAELFDVVKSVDRVVITGDLFDNPEQASANLFRAFRNNLGRLAQQEPIVVPGNHDQRILGNVGQRFKEVANLNWRTHVVDDRLGVSFLCFNSAETGSFARGCVTDDQRTRVAGDWRNAIAMRSEVSRYLPVVLVHHHPFSFRVTKPITWIQRALAYVGMDEEQFLEMEDAQSFVEWCAQWRAPVILHGHKHQARFIDDEVSPPGGRAMRISAIGCGSSLGAEGSALSYNVVQWDARHQRWVASFFESVNAGPFVQRAVMVEQRESAAA